MMPAMVLGGSWKLEEIYGPYYMKYRNAGVTMADGRRRNQNIQGVSVLEKIFYVRLPTDYIPQRDLITHCAAGQ